MIAASRRRRPGVVSADEAFRLHLRMARRAAWSTRLMRGSLLALLASLVALFAGAELGVHLGACAAALLVGLALPVPGAHGAALAEIRSVAGLSYETALDLFERESPVDAPDPYGFRSAVVDRARLSVSDIRPASPPAWWLPALAVALALLLFGVLERPFVNGGQGGGGAGGAQGGASGPAEPGAAPETEAEEPEIAPPEPEAGRAEEPEDAGAGQPGEEADSPAVAPPAEGNDAAAPMSRFLDSLRERPPEAGESNPGQPEGPQAGQDESGEAGDQGQQGQGPQSQRDGEPQRAEVQSGASPSGEQADGEAEGPENGENAEAGDSSAGQEQGEAGGDEGAQEPGEQGTEEQAAGGSEQDGQAEAPAGQPGSELDEGQSQFEAGGAEGESADSQDGGGAGAAAGLEQEAGVAEGGQGQPDFLEGVLEDGPENPAGAVRLPGSDDVALPPGRSVSDYQSAAEDALTEGDLPLSYQEIIRRYFQ